MAAFKHLKRVVKEEKFKYYNQYLIRVETITGEYEWFRKNLDFLLTTENKELSEVYESYYQELIKSESH